MSGDNFWHGATEDHLARAHMGALLRNSGVNPTARRNNVVAFSAMAAVPWMSVVERWDAKNGTNTPMVAIPAASNDDQIPLRANGLPALNRQGGPMTAMQDILLGFDGTSSAYAAATAAAPVLRMFRLRAAT